MAVVLFAFDQKNNFYFLNKNEPDAAALMLLSNGQADLSLYVFEHGEFREITVLYHPDFLQGWLADFQRTVHLRRLPVPLDLSVLDKAQ